MTRRTVSGRFDLNIPAREAIEFFTPEGERSWVPGWDPRYPGGEPSDTPGTVFVTHGHGADTVWVIHSIDATTSTATYSRVTPGQHAGTVSVRCEDGPETGCTVTVTYDMSLLPGADPSALDGYADRAFEEMLTDWSTALRRIL
jgi:hypothetical protein